MLQNQETLYQVKQWYHPTFQAPTQAGTGALSSFTASILEQRGITSKEAQSTFLSSGLQDLHDTRLMKDALKAVRFIKRAIDTEQTIVIYSDYDSDGVNSAVIGVTLLRQLGAKAYFYTNNRFTQGYGMMPSGVDAILTQYPETSMIITCDNGIMAFDGVSYAKSKGLDVIVTDHHEPDDVLPEADAIVDPKQTDCDYPFRELCGAGVIFKLMHLLYQEMAQPLDPVYAMLDVVALATVGDIVPLVDENRLLVKEGLKLIKAKQRPTFRILEEVTEPKEINAHLTLAFMYVPMINAIGRLEGDPRLAIEMFLTEDEEEIERIARYLKETNDKRKQMTREQVERAEEIVEQKGLRPVIVVYDDSFDEGIAGLIAGRLKEKYHRPVFAFTKTEDGTLKGSGRSIDNFHLKKAFGVLSDVMIGGGGHAKAGGLSIRPDQLDAFDDAVNALAEEWLTEEDLVKKKTVDVVITPQMLSLHLLDELKALEPYGEGFPKPVIMVKDYPIHTVKTLGKEKNHLKFTDNDTVIIMWQGQNILELNQRNRPYTLSCLGFPQVNVFRNTVTLQFIVDDDNITTDTVPNGVKLLQPTRLS